MRTLGFSLLIGTFVFSTVVQAFQVSRKGTSLNYASWVENMRITQGNVFEESTASFAGYELSQQTRVEFPNKKSLLVDFSLIFGQAQAGGSTTILNYTSERKNFFGGIVAPYIELRYSPSIQFKLGPAILYRSAKWESEDPTKFAKSGADVNVIWLANMEFLISKRVYIDQSIGSLSFNGKAYWSVGMGYLW